MAVVNRNNHWLKCSIAFLFLVVILVNTVNLVRCQDLVFLDEDYDSDNCLTPNGTVGSCVNLKECQPILDFLKSLKQPVSENIKKRLRAFICSLDEICCPSSNYDILSRFGSENREENPVTESESLPAPPDVSNHRNIGLLPKDCGYLDIIDKITQGEDTNLFEFPWMALLFYNTKHGARSRCGGTIINEKYILTAAHCITKLKDPLAFVRIGEYDLSTEIDCVSDNNGIKKCSDPFQDVKVLQVIAHSQFNTTDFNNDIGLIRVTKMNITKRNAKPICLPIDVKSRTLKFSNALVTGWGHLNNVGTPAIVLQKAKLPIVPLTECQRIFKEHDVLVNYLQICAGSKSGVDSCYGDSGGPLQLTAFINNDTRYVQQGLVSYGSKECGSVTIPAVYTKIPYFMDWILDNMKP